MRIRDRSGPWNKVGTCHNCEGAGRLRLGRCNKCYAYFHRHGENRPQGYIRFVVPPHAVRSDGSIAIQLTRGHVAIVDAVDADLARVKWFAKAQARGPTYAIRRERDSESRLHRIVLARKLGRDLAEPSSEGVDHKNGNGLDCRRDNLRLATPLQNTHNRRKLGRLVTSRFKGVYWDGEHRKWRVTITCRQHRRHLGRFTDEHDAALAYDAAALRLHGAFARLNFPPKVA